MLNISGQSASVVKIFPPEVVKQTSEKTFSSALNQVANADNKITVRCSAPAVFEVKAQIAPPSSRLQRLMDNHNARSCKANANRLSRAVNARVRDKNALPGDDGKSVTTVRLKDTVLNKLPSRLKQYPKRESPSLIKQTLAAKEHKSLSEDNTAQSIASHIAWGISQLSPKLKVKNYAEVRKQYGDFINVTTSILMQLEDLVEQNNAAVQIARETKQSIDYINRLINEKNKKLSTLTDSLADYTDGYLNNLKKVYFNDKFFPAQEKTKVKALQETAQEFVNRIEAGIERVKAKAVIAIN